MFKSAFLLSFDSYTLETAGGASGGGQAGRREPGARPQADVPAYYYEWAASIQALPEDQQVRLQINVLDLQTKGKRCKGKRLAWLSRISEASIASTQNLLKEKDSCGLRQAGTMAAMTDEDRLIVDSILADAARQKASSTSSGRARQAVLNSQGSGYPLKTLQRCQKIARLLLLLFFEGTAPNSFLFSTLPDVKSAANTIIYPFFEKSRLPKMSGPCQASRQLSREEARAAARGGGRTTEAVA